MRQTPKSQYEVSGPPWIDPQLNALSAPHRGLRLEPRWLAHLACPVCRNSFLSNRCETQLMRSGLALSCRECGTAYPDNDGIINFASADDFYEHRGFTRSGRDFGSDPIGRLGLYFARHHYLYDIHRTVTPGAQVIEIGCGGGSAYLASRYAVLGVDVSSRSIRQAASTYRSVVQASVERLPLADGCADAVVSSYLLEHLPAAIVERCVREMGRLVRSRGWMVHCFDLDGDGPFHRWAKRKRWFEQVFVLRTGHCGLRKLEQWRNLFREAGFELLEARVFCNSWLQDSSIWAALDDPAVSGFARLLGKAAGATRRLTGPAVDMAVTLIEDCFASRLPEHWAGKAIVVLRRAA